MKRIKIEKNYFSLAGAKSFAAKLRRQLKKSVSNQVFEVKIAQAFQYKSEQLRKQIGTPTKNDFIVVTTFTIQEVSETIEELVEKEAPKRIAIKKKIRKVIKLIPAWFAKQTKHTRFYNFSLPECFTHYNKRLSLAA